MSLRSLGLAFALAASAFGLPTAAPALDEQSLGFEITPPRLSFADGSVSFLRPGADDWTPARVNTALAAGDELFSAESSNLELQIGSRAYLRAGEQTQLGLASLEPDYLQFRLTSGHLSLDLRSLKAGQTLEVATPNAAFTVERTGYYRVEVGPETTSFTSRRGGHARVTLAGGETATIAASEQLVVQHGDAPSLASYAAPELDAWDRWNYGRTDDQLDAVSARYVASDVYGADQLDQYGDWRVVPSYGAVWVPRGVATGWVPYSTGLWMHDPYYGWTWVDDAPWGWAPYHYGRWVHTSGFWGWYPGPLVRRAYYSPALVAFYGGGLAYGVRPAIGWVALGYGEPLYPWWGPTWFRSRPCWVGWHGPRSHHWDHDDDHDHHGGHGGGGGHGHGGGGHDGGGHDGGGHDGGGHGGGGRGDRDGNWDHKGNRDRSWDRYQNAKVKDAVVATNRSEFGRRSPGSRNFWRARQDEIAPLERDPGVTPDASSRVADARPGRRPPQETRERSVVATRAPQAERGFARNDKRESWRGEKWQPTARRERGAQDGGVVNAVETTATPTRVAAPARDGARSNSERRAPWGRSNQERRIPPPAPGFEPSGRSARSGDVRDAGSGNSDAPQQWRGNPSWTRQRGVDRSATPDTSTSVQRPAPPAASSNDRVAQPTDRRHFERGSERNESRGDTLRSSRVRAPEPPKQSLPGEPANRVYRRNDDSGGWNRGGGGSGRSRPSRSESATPRIETPSVDAAPRARSSNAGRSSGGGGGRRDSGSNDGGWQGRGNDGGGGNRGGWGGGRNR